jgi:hypothetical protein
MYADEMTQFRLKKLPSAARSRLSIIAKKQNEYLNYTRRINSPPKAIKAIPPRLSASRQTGHSMRSEARK